MQRREGKHTLYDLPWLLLSLVSPREAIRISLPVATIISESLMTMTCRRPEGVWPSSDKSSFVKSGSVFRESSRGCSRVCSRSRVAVAAFEGEKIGWPLRNAFQSSSPSMFSKVSACWSCKRRGEVELNVNAGGDRVGHAPTSRPRRAGDSHAHASLHGTSLLARRVH